MKKLLLCSLVFVFSALMLTKIVSASVSSFTASGFSQFCSQNPLTCKKVDQSGFHGSVSCPVESQTISSIYVHAGNGQQVIQLPDGGYTYLLSNNNHTVTVNVAGSGRDRHELSWIGVVCVSPSPTPSASPSPSSSPSPSIDPSPSASPEPSPTIIPCDDEECTQPSPTPSPSPSVEPTPMPTPDPTDPPKSDDPGTPQESLPPGPVICDQPFQAPILQGFHADGKGSVTFSWWPTPGVQKYSIVYGYTSDKLEYGADNIDPNSTSFQINGLTPGKHVWAQVWAWKDGCAEKSNIFDPIVK